MTRMDTVRPEFVDSFPDPMSPGVLYVSIPYRTCGHLCCCGCGNEVITPLSPSRWAMTYDGQTVSVWPSIGNWALPCQSHYIIHKGRIRWSSSFTPAEIRANRDRDLRLLEREITPPHEPSITAAASQRQRWRLWRLLRPRRPPEGAGTD